MEISYGLDVQAISIEAFQRMLENKDLLPSRKMLLDDIDAHFAALKAAGVITMADLVIFLKTSKRVAQAAEATGIPKDYLKVLRREVGGYQPKPLRLAEFKSLSVAQVAALQAAGIKTSFDLLHSGASKAGRADLSAQTGLPDGLVLELVQISDLCRVLGVGILSAEVFLEAGVPSVGEILTQSPASMLERTAAVYAGRSPGVAPITMNDILFCVDAAALLPLVLEEDQEKA
jgi:Domain of unknown function (DUF4332)